MRLNSSIYNITRYLASYKSEMIGQRKRNQGGGDPISYALVGLMGGIDRTQHPCVPQSGSCRPLSISILFVPRERASSFILCVILCT